MSNTSENFIKLNRTNLVNAIYRVFPIEKTRLRKGVKENIWPRLDFMHGRRNSGDRYFIFEEDYIETEWKDMISIHYINTSYHVQNTVMRIHIFSNNEISETSYIGFFTLRKIDEPRFMLSYIYPNWTNIYCNSKRFHVMKYRKAIHIAGHELTLYTYPLFVQDNITVACAQASMVSMTQYLHNKFDYSKVRIKELGNAFITGKTKLFPSAGLLPTQMIEIFNYYDISVGFKVFKCEEENHNEYDMEYEKYRQYIDYSVESGMPVILGITIEDNGIGMDETELAAVRQKLRLEPGEELQPIGNGGFGLHNVAQRVRIYYGDQAEILVESEKNIGTCFKIYLGNRKNS